VGIACHLDRRESRMRFISTFCAVLLLSANVYAADVRTNNDIFFDRALITKENVQEAIAH